MDEDLRRLERAAAQGDRAARLELLRGRARSGAPPSHAAVGALLAMRNARRDYPLAAADVWGAVRAVVGASGLAHRFVQKVAYSPRVPGPPRNAGRSRRAVDDLASELEERQHLTDAERNAERNEMLDEMHGVAGRGRGPGPGDGFSLHVAVLVVVTGPSSPVAIGAASAWLARPDPPLDAFWPGLSSISEPARVRRFRDWAGSRGPDRVHIARDEARAILGV